MISIPKQVLTDRLRPGTSYVEAVRKVVDDCYTLAANASQEARAAGTAKFRAAVVGHYARDLSAIAGSIGEQRRRVQEARGPDGRAPVPRDLAPLWENVGIADAAITSATHALALSAGFTPEGLKSFLLKQGDRSNG